MKLAAILITMLTAVIFFAFNTQFMTELNSTSAWTGIGAPDWELGALKIAVPFIMLVFGVYISIAIFKGRDKDGGQGMPQ